MARKAMYLVFLVGVLLGVSLFSNSRVQAADDLEDETVTANLGKQKHGSATDDEVVQREEEASKLDGLSVAEINNLRESAEKHQFQAEVNRMMKLIINSLYRNNEIFLRDLISNASDALDKIRLLSLTNPNVLNDIEELSIRIKADKENHALHITDTGIGMTKADLINNLGTIACFGTSEFLSKLLDTATSAEQQEGLISQLGVGFCSSFLVADRVVFTTRKIHDEQYIWDSDSLSFSIVEDPRGNTLKRGSQVTLYLKEEAYDFLEPDTLKKLVQKYSKFINFDIFLWQSKTETVEEPEEKSEDSAFGGEKEPKTKNVEKTVRDWEKIKSVEPIWMRKGHDVPEVLTDIASSLKILTDIASSLKELINSSNESIASSLKELINSSNESIELLKKKGTTSVWAKIIQMVALIIGLLLGFQSVLPVGQIFINRQFVLMLFIIFGFLCILLFQLCDWGTVEYCEQICKYIKKLYT